MIFKNGYLTDSFRLSASLKRVGKVLNTFADASRSEDTAGVVSPVFKKEKFWSQL